MPPTSSTTVAPAIPGLARLRPLLGEINDTKRVRTADHPASLANLAFRRAWGSLLLGEDPSAVAVREAARALLAARLGGIDAANLARGGLGPAEIRAVFERAIDALADPLGPDLLGPIRAAAANLAADPASFIDANVPDFVDRLARQPRAGATRPGRPRLILDPPEDHAEHCQVTAIYAVLVALRTGADPGVPYLAGLAHHFHNAYLPDSGFAGEELLGDHLRPIMDRFTARAIGQLPRALAARVEAARSVLDHADTPEARAFHAADVLDRVLQMDHYAQVAGFELSQALDDLELIHAGPLQAFGNSVLAESGLVG